MACLLWLACCADRAGQCFQSPRPSQGRGFSFGATTWGRADQGARCAANQHHPLVSSSRFIISFLLGHNDRRRHLRFPARIALIKSARIFSFVAQRPHHLVRFHVVQANAPAGGCHVGAGARDDRHRAPDPNPELLLADPRRLGFAESPAAEAPCPSQASATGFLEVDQAAKLNRNGTLFPASCSRAAR